MSTDADGATQEPGDAPLWSSLGGIAIIVAALVLAGGTVGGLLVLVGGGDPAPPAEGPSAVAPVLGAPTAATPDAAGGVLLWTRETMLDHDGLELDDAVPRRGGGGDLYTANWTQVSTSGKAAIAVWTRSGPPTARDCAAEVTASGGASARAETGLWFCVVTDDGRPAAVNLLRKSPFGSYGWIVRATVWERPL